MYDECKKEPIELKTSTRELIEIIDIKEIYGDDGVIAKVNDINLANIICEMLNNRVKYRKNKAFETDDLYLYEHKKGFLS
jgi:hypothetical protein